MMPADKEKELRLLFSQWLEGNANESDIRRLADFAEDQHLHPVWQVLLQDLPEQAITEVSDSEQTAILQKVYDNLIADQPELRLKAPLRRITPWMKYAAAALLLAAGGLSYLYLSNRTDRTGSAIVQSVPDETPANSHSASAVLTLGDGRQIILDSSGDGQLAQQNGALIFRQHDGKITYQKKEPPAGTAVQSEFNTVSTPRGIDCKIVLPDGTAVWLNAASSITFPTAFTGNSRTVAVKGEVYLDVAKDQLRPFKVTIDNGEIDVLGTHFNINDYKEETVTRISLLEGSIRYSNARESRLLKPGEQLSYDKGSQTVSLIKEIDPGQITAWMNGTFDFGNQTIETVMNQIGRWYNMEIVYNGRKPQGKFLGMMSRSTDLATLLKSLELTSGAKFSIETTSRNGHPGKIIVQP